MSRYKLLQDNCLQEYISKAVMRSIGGGIKGKPKLLSTWGRRVKKPAPHLSTEWHFVFITPSQVGGPEIESDIGKKIEGLFCGLLVYYMYEIG